MFGHISSKDEAYGSLPEDIEFLWRQIFQEIVFFLLKDPKHLSGMERLLDRLIVRIYRPAGNCVRMVRIGKSIMPQIVANSRYQETQAVQFIQL